jgi:hypothetical protein
MRCEAPLVVELVGVPGAGKTTIGHELVDLLASRGVRCGSLVAAGRAHAASGPLGRIVTGSRPGRARRFAQWRLFTLRGTLDVVPFSIAHRDLVRRVALAQLGRDVPLRLRLHALRGFLRLCGRYRCVVAGKGATDVVVLDDGFVHRSVQLHTSAYEDADLRGALDYLARVPVPDLLVHVRAGAATCEPRVHARGIWQHARHLSPPQITRYLGNAELIVTAVTDRARALGWNVIRLDNERRSLASVRHELDRELGAMGLA